MEDLSYVIMRQIDSEIRHSTVLPQFGESNLRLFDGACRMLGMLTIAQVQIGEEYPCNYDLSDHMLDVFDELERRAVEGRFSRPRSAIGNGCYLGPLFTQHPGGQYCVDPHGRQRPLYPPDPWVRYEQRAGVGLYRRNLGDSLYNRNAPEYRNRGLVDMGEFFERLWYREQLYRHLWPNEERQTEPLITPGDNIVTGNHRKEM